MGIETESGGEDVGAAQGGQQPMLTLEQVLALQGRIALEQQFQGGVSWFRTIAAFSVINTLLIAFKSGVVFVIALDFTRMVDIIASVLSANGMSWAWFVALVIDAAAIGLFLALGAAAARRKAWAFWLGLSLYALDGALAWLVLGDAINAFFHFFGLAGLWKGLEAGKTIQAIEDAQAQANVIRQPPAPDAAEPDDGAPA